MLFWLGCDVNAETTKTTTNIWLVQFLPSPKVLSIYCTGNSFWTSKTNTTWQQRYTRTNDGTTTLWDICFEEIHPHLYRHPCSVKMINLPLILFQEINIYLLVYSFICYLSTYHSFWPTTKEYLFQTIFVCKKNCFITQQVNSSKLVKSTDWPKTMASRARWSLEFRVGVYNSFSWFFL